MISFLPDGSLPQSGGIMCSYSLQHISGCACLWQYFCLCSHGTSTRHIALVSIQTTSISFATSGKLNQISTLHPMQRPAIPWLLWGDQGLRLSHRSHEDRALCMGRVSPPFQDPVWISGRLAERICRRVYDLSIGVSTSRLKKTEWPYVACRPIYPSDGSVQNILPLPEPYGEEEKESLMLWQYRAISCGKRLQIQKTLGHDLYLFFFSCRHVEFPYLDFPLWDLYLSASYAISNTTHVNCNHQHLVSSRILLPLCLNDLLW